MYLVKSNRLKSKGRDQDMYYKNATCARMQHGKGTFQGSCHQSKTLTFQIHALYVTNHVAPHVPLRAERRPPSAICFFVG